MIPILYTGVKLKTKNREFIGNICITPNGTHVARYGTGYIKVNDKRELIQGMQYIEREGTNEIWRKEIKDKYGYCKYVIKKVKIN
jgi:hypothetical protein